ncbi:MAG: hypothetical protein ACREEA_03990 [Stellaceae bacterium]
MEIVEQPFGCQSNRLVRTRRIDDRPIGGDQDFRVGVKPRCMSAGATTFLGDPLRRRKAFSVLFQPFDAE